MTTEKKPINLGALEVPEPERIKEPWIFRGACHLKEPEIVEGRLVFGLILDLGFDTYHEILGVLDGVRLSDYTIAVDFASNWAENGRPNDLTVCTLGRAWGRIWRVEIKRAELDLETLKVVLKASLADALVEQGLAMKCDNA